MQKNVTQSVVLDSSPEMSTLLNFVFYFIMIFFSFRDVNNEGRWFVFNLYFMYSQLKTPCNLGI